MTERSDATARPPPDLGHNGQRTNHGLVQVGRVVTEGNSSWRNRMKEIGKFLQDLVMRALDGRDVWRVSTTSYPSLPLSENAHNRVFELGNAIPRIYVVETTINDPSGSGDIGQAIRYSLYVMDCGKLIIKGEDVEEYHNLLKELVAVLSERNADTQQFLRALA
jgi:hypothetical protein